MYAYVYNISMYMYMYDVYTASVLEKGVSEKKMTVRGDLKSFCHAKYLPGGLTMFLVKKRLSKIKYGFEFSISNVDLDLF